MEPFSPRLALLAVLGWFFYKYLRTTKPTRLPLPPGPKGYPIIGSLFDFPTTKPWLVYDKWFKTYGDIVYLKVLGRSFLLLGTLERVNDIFERRSKNYSDRPRMPMLLENIGLGFLFVLLPYGSSWRRQRRAFHNFFHPNVVDTYYPIQVNAARRFLRNILVSSPERHVELMHTALAETIMEVSYGIKIKGLDDPYVKDAESVLEGLADGGTPGRYLVDVFPFMKHIPAWFPGAGWKRKANAWQDVNRYVARKPFELVKEQMKVGTAAPSIAASLIQKLHDQNSPDLDRATEEEVAMNTCAIAYIGGSDTTIAAIQTFFLAMCLYPEAQKKGQAELDRVLKGRLPEFNDRPSLPYIIAMVKETMRWLTVTPFGQVHMATDDDEYEGYHIPKGTIVIGDAWRILHDPEIYKNPDHFVPDRFIKDGKFNEKIRDPSVAAFGFGRRICPGRYFSDNSLFIMIASVLAVYDVKPQIDDNGREVEIKVDVTGELLSHPLPFSFRIIPRSKAAVYLVNSSELLE
ncbi:hypothetical protein Agabi119p4_10849 [Agaricus bisporus var. burnettii]|uniref:Cytochrome P450 n=1 Tax=Agaricus bisporus var. burnettii TaxID=192524 RepID=A0A8H7C169_AGABI|nr:hypothetical protein Agabi119p4_10849 [Agaricus bisporus var. burnettii]